MKRVIPTVVNVPAVPAEALLYDEYVPWWLQPSDDEL